MRARRFGPLLALALLGGCVALLQSGPAASRTDASPVMRVDYRFDGVRGSRPPNIVETRIVGKGRLEFDTSPVEGASKRASRATGRIVVELDVLDVERPRTVRLTLDVHTAEYATNPRKGTTTIALFFRVVKTANTTGTDYECSRDAGGRLDIGRSATQVAYDLILSSCGLRGLRQQVPIGRNSRVHVTFDPKCLRTTQARKPLCTGKTTGPPKPPAKPKPPAAAGTFTLVPGLTEVKNARPPELTVDAAGQTAVWDHTGQFGGAGKGGEWRVDFKWNVPQTLTPGKSSSLTLGLQVSNVRPEQPILFQIGARAYDFKQVIDLPYPNPAGLTKSFSIPVSMSYKDYKELFVIVDVVGAEVIYHYKK
jgi:hypothetical protein